MTDADDAEQDFVSLRDHCHAALLATISAEGDPSASYAPILWIDRYCYLFLSDLASHSANLRANPRLSLMLLQPESEVTNAFARQRITLQGVVEVIGREQPEFEQVIAAFHQRFGQVMSVIEPLADFHLFRVELQSGQFVRGFGQAFRLSGERLDRLEHIRPV